MSAAATSLISAMNGCGARALASPSEPAGRHRRVGIAGQRPAQPAGDERRTQGSSGQRRPHQVPAQVALLRRIDRVVDDEHGIQLGDLEDRLHCRTRTGNAERGAEPLRRGVRAHQGPHAAAVDRRHTAQVDEQVGRPVPEERLYPLLEFLGRPPCDESFLRRQYDPTADRVLGNGHVKVCEEYSKETGEPANRRTGDVRSDGQSRATRLMTVSSAGRPVRRVRQFPGPDSQ